MKFKIGDTVRVKRDKAGEDTNKIGKIISSPFGAYDYEVEGDSFVFRSFDEEELELVEEKKEHKFKVGDKVRVIKCLYDTKIHEGVETVISLIMEEGYLVKNDGCVASEVELIVEPQREEVKEEKTAARITGYNFTKAYFDEMLPSGWTTRYIDWVHEKTKQPKKTLMKKVSTLARKLFDADTRALVEAGYLFDDLTLSSEGKNVLLDMLFLQYKKQMAVEARKAIRASKKCGEDEETEEE